MSETLVTDLAAIGLGFPRWQDAVEAAIASNGLAVTGEVRGGQLIQYSDPSGAQLNILAVEPFATFAGFDSVTRTYAHITPLSDVVALADIVDPHGGTMASVTVNLAQGPLLADAAPLSWQELSLTALMLSCEVHDSVDAYLSAHPGEVVGEVRSEGAEGVAKHAPQAPDARAEFSARVLEAEFRTSQLTRQRFVHATVDAAFPFDVCLPEGMLPGGELPARNSVISGSALLVGSIPAPSGSGCGGCGGSCGCGGH